MSAHTTVWRGWLLPRLREFQARHPFVELRLFTHNNRIDLAAEGLAFGPDKTGARGVWVPVPPDQVPPKSPPK